MNSNLFERKTYLDGSWMTNNITEYFSVDSTEDNVVIRVNLLRATANEANSFKNYLSSIPAHYKSSTIIDLSECNFIDSTFLSSIISFNKVIDSEIKLVIADARQLAIFRITKLDSLFNIYASMELATAA